MAGLPPTLPDVTAGPLAANSDAAEPLEDVAAAATEEANNNQVHTHLQARLTTQAPARSR